MWGAFFPEPIPRPETYKTKSHSNGCKMLGGNKILMADLDLIMQEFVMECGHPSHDSVRQLFMVLSNSDLSESIEEGRLF